MSKWHKTEFCENCYKEWCCSSECKYHLLHRIKEAREEVAKYQSIHDSYCEYIEKGDYWEGHTPNHYESSGGKATACDYFLQILDKLIAESED